MNVAWNSILHITALSLIEVFKDVRVEPLLQQLTEESLQNEVRLDICARGFWGEDQATFFDVSVFNPNATRCAKLKLSKSYEIKEKEKKEYYNERIMQIEYGSFTPHVMLTTGGMDRKFRRFNVGLSEMINEKRDVIYSTIATCIRRKITFSLIKSIGLSTSGRSSTFSSARLEKLIGEDAGH